MQIYSKTVMYTNNMYKYLKSILKLRQKIDI